jgi:hypothetical protein
VRCSNGLWGKVVDNGGSLFSLFFFWVWRMLWDMVACLNLLILNLERNWILLFGKEIHVNYCILGSGMKV